MKAISIRQPWAWAVIHAGKNIENRTWSSGHRGPLLIHAGKSFDMDGWQWLKDHETICKAAIPAPEAFEMGGVVGAVEMVGCVSVSSASCPNNPWFFGPWGFVFENPGPLPFTPYRGRLGLFDIPEEAVKWGAQ